MKSSFKKDGPAAGVDHFLRLVSDWSHFGPPLRPSAADTRIIAQVAARLAPHSRVVILGVTPETAACGWHPTTRLLAVDHSVAMISALWEGEGAPESAKAVAAAWAAMPLRSGSAHAIVGDGCYNMFPYPGGFRDLTREIDRVLGPGGRLAMRVFVRPEPDESLKSVERDFRAGRIRSVHALKVRLWAAVQGPSSSGVCLGEVWEAWRRLPMIDSVAEGGPGWSIEEIAGMEAYRSLSSRYFLSTAAEFQSVLLERFERVECFWTDGELSERCPTFVAYKAASPEAHP